MFDYGIIRKIFNDEKFTFETLASSFETIYVLLESIDATGINSGYAASILINTLDFKLSTEIGKPKNAEHKEFICDAITRVVKLAIIDIANFKGYAADKAHTLHFEFLRYIVTTSLVSYRVPDHILMSDDMLEAATSCHVLASNDARFPTGKSNLYALSFYSSIFSHYEPFSERKDIDIYKRFLDAIDILHRSAETNRLLGIDNMWLPTEVSSIVSTLSAVFMVTGSTLAQKIVILNRIEESGIKAVIEKDVRDIADDLFINRTEDGRLAAIKYMELRNMKITNKHDLQTTTQYFTVLYNTLTGFARFINIDIDENKYIQSLSYELQILSIYCEV